MKIIAHRGGGFDTPENTLAAFANAIALGVDSIELDIHLSKDGVPVVIHDTTLDRTTNAIGEVNKRTVSELRQIDAGNGEYVPTLAEVLDLIDARLPLVLEFKSVEAIAPAAELIRTHPNLQWSGLCGLPEGQAQLAKAFPEIRQVAGTLGSPKSAEALLEIVKQHSRSLPEGYLDTFRQHVEKVDLEADLDKASDLGAWLMIVFYTGLDQEILDKVRERGFTVGAWTVNDPEAARRMLELDVDMLITDDPKTMMKLVANASTLVG